MKRTRANMGFRDRMKACKVTFWELAVEIGIAESSLIRWFRQEMPDEQRNRVDAALKRLEVK